DPKQPQSPGVRCHRHGEQKSRRPQYLATTGYFPTGYLPGSLPIGALPTAATGGGSRRGRSAAEATPTNANVATTASNSFAMTAPFRTPERVVPSPRLTISCRPTSWQAPAAGAENDRQSVAFITTGRARVIRSTFMLPNGS